MAKAKIGLSEGIEYSNFSDPWRSLAVLIFAQAITDLYSLKGMEKRSGHGGETISRWEIINFFRSPWAAILADGLGIDWEYQTFPERQVPAG